MDTGGKKKEKKALQHQHKLTIMNSSKPEHTAVLIMVYDTLESYRNDRHESPLKLLSRIYMDLTCQLMQLSTRTRIDAGQKIWLDSRKLEKRLYSHIDECPINIQVHQQKSICTFSSFHLNVYLDVNPYRN